MTIESADYWATCDHCRSATLPGEVYMLLEVHYGGDPTCPHCFREQADWTFHKDHEATTRYIALTYRRQLQQLFDSGQDVQAVLREVWAEADEVAGTEDESSEARPQGVPAARQH
jgi:hypothetical protein